MAVAEAIVICIDNSVEMISSNNYQTQWDVIECYCKAKFDAHPETEVAVFSMGTQTPRLLLFPPTRDLQKIMGCYPRIYHDPGRLRFLDGVKRAWTGFTWKSPDKQKRVLFFTGGPTDLSTTSAYDLGKRLKNRGMAVDVVNFHLEEKLNYMALNRFGMAQLNAFVSAANHNNNSHIEHVEPGLSICAESFLKNHHKNATGSADNEHVPNLNRFEVSRSFSKKAPRLSTKKYYPKKATGTADNEYVLNLNRFEALSLDK